MLVFYVGNDRYGIDTSQVVEVIPMVILRKLPHAPDYIAGVFNYRGKIVPAIDLCHLIQGLPSRSYLSTRIVMVNYFDTGNTPQLVGLMAERVTETINKPDNEGGENGFEVKEAPYLGEMIMDEQGMIQQVRLEYLLSERKHLV
ncbi:MAG TPA: chemotaxis protein CheW [Cyanobacteria bacterium UBA8803]|nr:chemotaxis protein CheW [Cyanobacteria bacterium UBA9273]HBL62932.1 chemotaxis protein CheW [Cyanobacteria bacterium UBA8803]